MATDASIGLDPAFSYDNLTMQIGRRDSMSSGLEQRRWPAKSQSANEMTLSPNPLGPMLCRSRPAKRACRTCV